MNSEIKIFISHAEQNFDTALTIYHELKRAGLEPWMADEDILPGQKRGDARLNALQDSSYFLALISFDTITEKGFLKGRLKTDMDMLEENPPSESIFIIPVRLDDCEISDEYLKKLKPADLFRSFEEGIGKLVEAIKRESKTLYKNTRKALVEEVLEQSGLSVSKLLTDVRNSLRKKMDDSPREIPQKAETEDQEKLFSAIRKLVDSAFDDEELYLFCFDHFQEVRKNYTSGQTKNARALMLVDYVRRNGLVEELLREVRRLNPYQYSVFESKTKYRPGKFERATHHRSEQSESPMGIHRRYEKQLEEMHYYIRREDTLGAMAYLKRINFPKQVEAIKGLYNLGKIKLSKAVCFLKEIYLLTVTETFIDINRVPEAMKLLKNLNRLKKEFCPETDFELILTLDRNFILREIGKQYVSIESEASITRFISEYVLGRFVSKRYDLSLPDRYGMIYEMIPVLKRFLEENHSDEM